MLAVLLLNRMTVKRRIARKQTLIKSVKVNKKVPEEFYCRTCLSTDDLESIFTSKSHEKRSRELELATGLMIKMDDGLSQKMCIKCLGTLKAVLEFRRTSKKAEKSLLEMVGQRPKKKCKLRKKSTKSASVKESRDENYSDDDNEFKYDVGIENDDYEDSKEFQNTLYQDNTYQGDAFDTLKEEESEVKVKSKPAAKPPSRKRQVLPSAPPYKCGTCSKEFRMKATFKAHMRFHTNYCVCETCGKRCRNNNQLQEHKRARHGLGRIHTCAYCEYSAATKEALTIHERRHTGERPYVCDHCGATFHRRSNLVQHIAIHLPDKNFQCDMCPKRLKSRKFLQIHKHNAHTGRRYGYLCAVCDHRFEKPNKVRAHTRRVHGLPDDRQGPIVRVQL